jgi:uncharacterized RDD family membrane protein YckC
MVHAGGAQRLSRWSRWRARRKDRAARRAKARATRGTITDFLPPEGVPIRLDLAPIGSRFGAQLADMALTQVVPVALVLVLAFGFGAGGEALGAIWALTSFMSRTPYYILAEIVWNGRTIGKRMSGIRVISADGRSLTPRAAVLRNLMKEGEVFGPVTWLIASPGMGGLASFMALVWVGVVLAVPLFDRRNRRLGDMIAGTLVIMQPKAALPPDLAAAPSARRRARTVFLPHQLDHYGAFELQTLEKLLQAPGAGDPAARARRAKSLAAVSGTVRGKIAFEDRVAPDGHEAFLRAFYLAQRLHLEKKQLMGDKRADKRHAETPDDDALTSRR